MSVRSEDEQDTKDMLFSALVWAVGILLTLSGATMAYLYQTAQTAMNEQFHYLQDQTTKQWERISLIENRLSSNEWAIKQMDRDKHHP